MKFLGVLVLGFLGFVIGVFLWDLDGQTAALLPCLTAILLPLGVILVAVEK